MSKAQSGTRISRNRGQIVGPKPPLKPKHIWAIRTRLQHDGRVRDLAMFATAIDSKLRAVTSSSCASPVSTWVIASGCEQPSFSRRPADPYRLS